MNPYIVVAAALSSAIAVFAYVYVVRPLFWRLLFWWGDLRGDYRYFAEGYALRHEVTNAMKVAVANRRSR